MEIFTGKRRGRPRKALDVPSNDEQVSQALGDELGDGQAGANGSGTPAELGAEGWKRLCAEVTSYKSWKNTVAVAYHPEPVEKMIQTACGWVRVLPGPLGYEMNSGEKVAL